MFLKVEKNEWKCERALNPYKDIFTTIYDSLIASAAYMFLKWKKWMEMWKGSQHLQRPFHDNWRQFDRECCLHVFKVEKNE